MLFGYCNAFEYLLKKNQDKGKNVFCGFKWMKSQCMTAYGSNHHLNVKCKYYI